jgi:hypothetical protein
MTELGRAIKIFSLKRDAWRLIKRQPATLYNIFQATRVAEQVLIAANTVRDRHADAVSTAAEVSQWLDAVDHKLRLHGIHFDVAIGELGKAESEPRALVEQSN